jgi:hypothetical protein
LTAVVELWYSRVITFSGEARARQPWTLENRGAESMKVKSPLFLAVAALPTR